MVRVVSPNIHGVFQPYFHYDCQCNQLRSIVGRVAGVVVKPQPDGLAMLESAARVLGRTLPDTLANDLLDMPRRYTGGKRARYERAAELLSMFGLFPQDAYCKMFVKAERLDGSAKRNPDPRAIQFRGAKYCVALAAYLHPIEHSLYLTEFCSDGVPKTRNIAKGLNSVERAELLVEKLSHFKCPVTLSIDASRFDKHVSYDLLKIEHSVYLASNADPEFAALLEMQLVNTIFSSTGIKYMVEGRRMSGDMNTACGNCVIMLLMVWTYCNHMNFVAWDVLDDGDDCLLILEGPDVDRAVSSLAPFFLKFGMEMEVESPVDSVFEVVFCQSNVIEYDVGRFKFVRDYRAVISKALCGLRHWQDPHYRRKVLKAIGACELVLNLSVPVLQEFSLAILRNVGGAGDIAYAPDGLRLRTSRDLRALGQSLESVQPRPILDCARLSFERAYGLGYFQQVELEQALSKWSFDVDGLSYWGDEWDVEGWIAMHSCTEVSPLEEKCRTQ